MNTRLLLATRPIVQVVALCMAYLFGLIYLITVTFPVVWSDVYGESLGIGGLNFISLGVGTILGVQVNMRFVDRIYSQLKKQNGDVGQPEFHVPSMFVESVLIPIGLFWYGWSVQGRVHWIMPNIGISIFSAGSVVCLQSMQAYIIDSYTRYAASGLAAAVVLRSLADFGFSLFGPYLYQRLGLHQHRYRHSGSIHVLSVWSQAAGHVEICSWLKLEMATRDVSNTNARTFREPGVFLRHTPRGILRTPQTFH